ncbi:aquaporin [Siphonobacter sp. BAB-5405]|uniref:MIP/aquaporin family protein n=1 Tax=Siphonobacter sp. BAB-5405 TaxID=1864825 RepID=UPI000C806B8E|nr:MIP/aquaporin family protein [Siphonobacter sp. BAB-5405]PMD98407.1 aquaporin [Siphonobacter sp. BAB-5405]
MQAFWGEFMGTLVLILLGDGVVANVLLKNSKGENSGWIVITAGWGFAVMLGIFVAKAFGSSDAHLNPAVTLAFAVSNQDFSTLLPYWLAQMIGAFLGAVLVWLQYLPHWAVTPEPSTKLAVFATGPAVRNRTGNFISEFIATAVLIIGVSAISGAGELAIGLGPYLVGLLVWSIGLSLGGTTGYAMSPARDLAPRIAHALLPIPGKGPSDWGYAWIPVVASLLGGVAGSLLFMAFH